MTDNITSLILLSFTIVFFVLKEHLSAWTLCTHQCELINNYIYTVSATGLMYNVILSGTAKKNNGRKGKRNLRRYTSNG